MNFVFHKYIESIIVLWTLSINCVTLDSGHDFLTSIINKLKEERPAEKQETFYDELFKATSRSSDEYQIYENNQDSIENNMNLFSQNNGLNHYENTAQPFNQWQNQVNLFPVNDLNSPIVNFLTPQPTHFDQQGTNTHLINLQQLALDNYLNFGMQQLQQPFFPNPILETTTEAGNAIHQFSLYDNKGPNLFNPSDNNVVQQQQLPKPVQDEQTNDASSQSMLQNQQSSNGLVPTNSVQNELSQLAYNYYNPDNAINDNLIDDTLDALQSYSGESSALGVHKQFMVEPLFVAMAGFVGITMIFMSAILFLPKIFHPPPQVSSLKGPQELAALTKLAVQAIEGNDCTERIACEVGRAMRSMQIGSKPIKVLEVLLPKNIANQLAQIRKAVTNKQVCRLIQCKSLKTVPSIVENKSKSAIEPESPKLESIQNRSSITSSTIKPDETKKKSDKNDQEALEPRVDVQTTIQSTGEKKHTPTGKIT